jgi:plastocyanin
MPQRSDSVSALKPIASRAGRAGPWSAAAWLGALHTALAMLFAPPAAAGTLAVHVVGADGSPAADVVVEVMAPGAALRVPTEPVLITQANMRFSPQVTAVPAGTTVRFANQDGFDHHLRSQPSGPLGSVAAAKDFEFRLPGMKADKAVTTDVLFDRAGLVVLGCHLHSSMRGHVYIAQSSLLAVTDSAGKAVIPAVPDGRVDVRYWHPEQLIEQSPAALQVAGPASLTATLNFKPSRARRKAG